MSVRAASVPRGASGSFDYEKKLWGNHEVELSPTSFGALRLKYCLDDLSSVAGKVLDVGCGGAGLTRAISLNHTAIRTYGCDFSRRAIHVAQQAGSPVKLGVSDAMHLPYRTSSFDAVVMFDVLEHLESPELAIREVERVLRPDGMFHLFVPCEGARHTVQGILGLIHWWSAAAQRYAGHTQRFEVDDVVHLLQARDLRIVRTRWSEHLLYQLAAAAFVFVLHLRGRNLEASVEGYVERVGSGLLSGLLQFIKRAFAATIYFESVMLSTLPGLGLHITCRKKQASAKPQWVSQPYARAAPTVLAQRELVLGPRDSQSSLRHPTHGPVHGVRRSFCGPPDGVGQPTGLAEKLAGPAPARKHLK